MDAFLTDSANVDYSGLPPVLLVGSSLSAMQRAYRTVEACGLRIGAQLDVAEAKTRIDQQGLTTAVWLELDRDLGGPMDDLLHHLSRDVDSGRYAAIVSATSELVDPIMASLTAGAAEVIVDASEPDRIAALATATFRQKTTDSLADVAADNNAERLRQLSEEVNRIASTLARLSAGPSSSNPATAPASSADVPQLGADTVRNVIRARRLRARYFDEELFADPAWDMLLDLLQAEIAQLRVPVSSLCIAAAVPATTALRWLKTMVGRGIFVRRADPHDGRRVFVELAPAASQALRRYFAEVGQAAAM